MQHKIRELRDNTIQIKQHMVDMRRDLECLMVEYIRVVKDWNRFYDRFDIKNGGVANARTNLDYSIDNVFDNIRDIQRALDANDRELIECYNAMMLMIKLLSKKPLNEIKQKESE